MLAGTYTSTAALHVCLVQTHPFRTVIFCDGRICCFPYIDLVTKFRFVECPIKYGIQTHHEEKVANESNLHPKKSRYQKRFFSFQERIHKKVPTNVC